MKKLEDNSSKPSLQLNQKNFTKTIGIPVLWLVAIGAGAYFAWQYYSLTPAGLGNGDGSIKMKNANHAVFPQIEANKAERIQMNDNTYATYTVDLKASRLTFYHKTPEGKPIGTFAYLNQYLERQTQTLVFATNGGIYTKILEPLGLYVENGKEIVPVNRKKGTDNFYLEPNGVFYIKNGEAYIETTNDYSEKSEKLNFATQSGPMLVIDGDIHPRFVAGSANKYIRSGVGIINEDKVVFVISEQAVNFHDLAVLFKERFNCENALYLDGAISKMYLPELNLRELDNTIGLGSFICIEKK